MCAKFLQKQAKTVAVMIWKKFEDRHQTDRQTDRQWSHQSPILQKPAAQLKKRNETVFVGHFTFWIKNSPSNRYNSQAFHGRKNGRVEDPSKDGTLLKRLFSAKYCLLARNNI